MQNGTEIKPAEQSYCFNCGSSNATQSASVTVGYRSGGGNSFIKASRPHCKACSDVEGSVGNIFIIILLSAAALFLAHYILNEL